MGKSNVTIANNWELTVNFSSLPTTFCKCNIQVKYAEIAIKNTDSNVKNCAYQTILEF